MGSFSWRSLSRSIIIGDAKWCCPKSIILSVFISGNFEFCENGGSGGSSLVLGFSQVLIEKDEITRPKKPQKTQELNKHTQNPVHG